MPDPKKTEALFLAAEQEEARTKYDHLLNEMLDEVHKIAIRAQTHGVFVDDSRAHELVRNLRDNFGPEVP